MLDLQDLIADRYLIQSHLHHGYMSDVYHAYDQNLQCDVAIKLVCHDQTESRLRLYREIQALRSLTHDHILPILDHGEYGLYHYLVMPYFKHGTLRKRISKEVLSEEEAGKILDQVSSALQVAHDHGILHRDIKPSNILLSDEDDLYVYLADFGLAKAISAASEITQTGCIIGTPEYMAPELIDKPESVSSEIYSLGILLYHMLTGQPPFRGSIPLEILWRHVHEWPVSPSQLNPAITLPVEKVILRAIHKNPKKRYPNAKALAEAYSDALQLSQQSKVPFGLPVLENGSTLKSLKELNHMTLPTAVQQSAPIVRSRKHPHTHQRTFMSLALVVMFSIPLSLGFLVGRDRTDVSPAFSASFASALHKSVPHVASPSPTPLVFPMSGKKFPPHIAPSVHQHKHRHPHHRNGNNSTISIDT
jgi:serine/threonine protein kinase